MHTRKELQDRATSLTRVDVGLAKASTPDPGGGGDGAALLERYELVVVVEISEHLRPRKSASLEPNNDKVVRTMHSPGHFDISCITGGVMYVYEATLRRMNRKYDPGHGYPKHRWQNNCHHICLIDYYCKPRWISKLEF